MAVNKIIYNNQTLIDLTDATIEKFTKEVEGQQKNLSKQILKGYKGYGKEGELLEGDCDFDANTTTDHAPTKGEILNGKTAFANGQQIDGTMPNRGKVEKYITKANEPVTISDGYHSGDGYVAIDPTEYEKLKDGKYILQGIEILGIAGTLEPASGVTSESQTVTPTAAGFTVVPKNADYLSQVTVNPIPFERVANENGFGEVIKIACTAG